MGQVLHGCATYAVRAAIQRSQATVPQIADRYGLNEKTVRKWRGRTTVKDSPMGPKKPRSTVLSPEEEAACVAFRRHTLLPLDDCLYALQDTIPHLTRSSLHRLYQRHGISRLPDLKGEAQPKRTFKDYPIGYFHIDIAEVRTDEGKLYMLVGIDRTSKLAFVELHEKATRRVAADFLRHLVAAVPYKVHTVLTDNVLCDEALEGRGRAGPFASGPSERVLKITQASSAVKKWHGPSKRRVRVLRGPHRPQNEVHSQAEEPNIIYEVAGCAPPRLCARGILPPGSARS